VRDQPNVSSNEFLDEVASTDDCAGKVEHVFTIPDTDCSVIVRSSTNGSQSFYSYRKGISRPIVVRNHRHVHLHIELVRAPIFCEVGLATRRDLDSLKPFSCILLAGVESAAGVVSLIILTIIELDDIWLDD
jgi:hypothetical protein